MRTLLLLAFVLSFNFSFAQKASLDTSISFTSLEGRWLTESRVVPEGSKLPLYVAIPYYNEKYENTGHLNYEYFRVDSSHYLFYEYFPNAISDYRDGIKSRGVKVVQVPKPDTMLVDNFDEKGNRSTFYVIAYRRALTKEGEWTEYEDSTSNPIFWKGYYRNDKRIGLWKRTIRDLSYEIVIQEIDFDKDSTQNIYSENIANIVSRDTLKKILGGARWLLRTNESFDKGSNTSYYRCKVPYGDLCGDKENYYSFDLSGDFTRNVGSYYPKVHPELIKGKWELIKQGDQWLIKVTFIDGQILQLRILYLDKNYQFLTQRD